MSRKPLRYPDRVECRPQRERMMGGRDAPTVGDVGVPHSGRCDAPAHRQVRGPGAGCPRRAPSAAAPPGIVLSRIHLTLPPNSMDGECGLCTDGGPQGGADAAGRFDPQLVDGV